MLVSAGKGLTTEVGHIWIDNDYFYQPYSDNEPYFVGYSDMDDDSIPAEGLEYAVCRTKEEADAIAQMLVQEAEKYNNSLLKDIYTFTEYLEMQEGVQQR